MTSAGSAFNGLFHYPLPLPLAPGIDFALQNGNAVFDSHPYFPALVEKGLGDFLRYPL